MRKFIYKIACKVIETISISEVVSYETFDAAENLLERAYIFYLTSNREDSNEAYIEGLLNMAKLFIGEQRINKILKRIYDEVNSKFKIWYRKVV